MALNWRFMTLTGSARHRSSVSTVHGILIELMTSVVLGLALAVGPLFGADAHMMPEERMKVLNWLDESHKEFLAAIESVTAEQWKPPPDGCRAPQCTVTAVYQALGGAFPRQLCRTSSHPTARPLQSASGAYILCSCELACPSGSW